MHIHSPFVHDDTYDFFIRHMYIIWKGNDAHFILQPDHTLTTTADVRGAKKAKDRITVALAVNITASERLKPVVIHKYKKPRCFGRTFNPNSLVMYYSNTNAWMRTDVRRN